MNELISRMVSYYSGDPKRIQHFLKVHSFAKLVGQMERLSQEEQEILEAAAIVHDIGIKKAEEEFGSSNGKLQEQLGPDIARHMLQELGYQEALIERVCYLVGHHHTYSDIQGRDYQILVEADFLVNFYEDELGDEAVKHTYDKIFRTATGKELCSKMYKINTNT